MAINIKFDTAGNPEPPSIILATKNGNKLGLLNVNADSIELNDKLKVSEISFTLNKYVDGKLNNLWDKVVDFKLVWCKEWDVWFEIKVELDEATETVKTVFGTQLGQAELSQIMVYNIEVNTEEDIARDDYKITILYDENDHEASLLHRILKDKAPHYSIAYVDPTIARIQRQFSWDGSSICDVLDEAEEEIGCLVVYNSNSTEGGKPNRSISVYDLEQNCNDCGYRGEFTDKCPKCGSKNIKYGYGEDTTIFVTNDELGSQGIQLVADVDSVKNCFKLEAGDDLMTATIRNCNPNGSDYIWRFSEDIKGDMSNELVEKLESYDAEYKRYYNEYESNLDATLLTQYNNLVEKYDDFYNTDSTCLNCDNKGKFYDKCPSCNSENLLTGKELQKISTPIVGYPSLMNAYYNTIDFALYLESGLMPSITMSDTTAEEQASLLTTSSLSPVAVNVKEVSSISLTTADSAVLSMVKVIIKSTYKVEILSSSLSVEKKWSGTFKITNYSDDTDTIEVVVNDIVVNNDAETFVKQKIEKALNKENTDDYSISGLFEKEYNEFCSELTKYALKPLQSFYDAADACISILTEQGAGDETNKPDLYENLYLPYFQKQEAIASEISIRKNELAIIEGIYNENTQTSSGGLQNNIQNCQSVIQDALNFEDYLGENLWKEFCSFRREDKYSNSNYISDGLNNAQLFEKALEFIGVAENEIYKSSELQHSISTSLNNLLAIDKFKPLVKYFKNGNWIRVRVDDKIYKLRLLEYNINFGSFESIPVEFSDVTKIKNSTTDVQNVLEQASSVASSYDAVTRQAKKGNVAKGTIEQWLDEGLSAANVQIQSNDSEEIIITKNGLLGRSYDDITGTYSPEQLKITHNIMAYTDDNWETVSSALGKHSYKKWNGSSFIDDEGYGLTSKFVTAGYITGSQIIGGEILSSNYQIGESGTYLNLIKGDFDFAGGKIVYNADKNRVTLSGVEIQWDSVNKPTVENIDGLSGITADIRAIEQGLSATTINGQYVISPNIIGGYLDIKNNTNNTGVVIDPNGLVNKDYIFRVYNGSTTTIGADINGNAEFSGTIKSSKVESTDIVGSTITGGTITAGDTLYIGSQKDEDGNIIENSYSAWIDTDGVLHTNEAHINGTITAIDGMIGGFNIEPTVIEDGVVKAGGTLWSGELQEGQDSVQIGDNKSIFLSATDMSGTVSNTTLTNWRLTVGEHFGVISDGTVYMSNCEITGGSLRMGTEDSGYYTWISEDGILNTNGANINGTVNALDGNIAGWKITTDALYRNTLGVSSGMCSMQAKDVSSEGLLYDLNLDENSYTVIGIGSCVDANIIIPSIYNNKPVTSIGEEAFYNCISLENIVIPNSITNIGDSAFRDCKSLTNVIFGDDSQLTNIGVYAFLGCILLTNIEIPDGVISIGNAAFAVCNSLTSVIIPNSVTNIGNSAFANCSSLKNVTFGDDSQLTNIAAYAFDDCSSLTSIVVPDSVTKIGNNAFDDCPSLTNVYYAGSQDDWNNITIYSNNSFLENATYYYNSSINLINNELVNNCVSLINTNNVSPPRFFAGSIKNIPTCVDDAKFLVLEDGSLYAKAAKISGMINVTDGEIGGLIIDNGIKGYIDDVESFSLTSNGLMINDTTAKIQVGNVKMFYDKSLNNTYLQANGGLYIRGMESGAPITSIELMTDTGSAPITSTIKFSIITTKDENNGKSVTVAGRLSTTQQLYYPVSYTIYYTTGQASTIDDATIRSMTFTLNPSQTYSEEKTFNITGWTLGLGVSYIRFGMTKDEVSKCSNYQMNSYSSWTDLMTIGTITQNKTNNNINIVGNVLPKTTDRYTLGNTDNEWSAIYAQTGEILSSDKNKKNTINTLNESYSVIFDNLQPVTFKYNNNTSDRLHIGFIAQEVKDAMAIANIESKDFAAYCEWVEESGDISCGLRYSEFIALCINEVQKLKKRVAELENK